MNDTFHLLEVDDESSPHAFLLTGIPAMANASTSGSTSSPTATSTSTAEAERTPSRAERERELMESISKVSGAGSIYARSILLVSNRFKHTPQHKLPLSPSASLRLPMPATRLGYTSSHIVTHIVAHHLLIVHSSFTPQPPISKGVLIDSESMVKTVTDRLDSAPNGLSDRVQLFYIRFPLEKQQFGYLKNPGTGPSAVAARASARSISSIATGGCSGGCSVWAVHSYLFSDRSTQAYESHAFRRPVLSPYE